MNPIGSCSSSDNFNINLILTALAGAIAQGLTVEEVGYLGDIYASIGQNLSMIASQREFCSDTKAPEEIPSGVRGSLII